MESHASGFSLGHATWKLESCASFSRYSLRIAISSSPKDHISMMILRPDSKAQKKTSRFQKSAAGGCWEGLKLRVQGQGFKSMLRLSWGATPVLDASSIDSATVMTADNI